MKADRKPINPYDLLSDAQKKRLRKRFGDRRIRHALANTENADRYRDGVKFVNRLHKSNAKFKPGTKAPALLTVKKREEIDKHLMAVVELCMFDEIRRSRPKFAKYSHIEFIRRLALCPISEKLLPKASASLRRIISRAAREYWKIYAESGAEDKAREFVSH